jgi:hypothetical protein
MRHNVSKIAKRTLAAVVTMATAGLFAAPALSSGADAPMLISGLAAGSSEACLFTLLAGMALVYRGSASNA